MIQFIVPVANATAGAYYPYYPSYPTYSYPYTYMITYTDPALREKIDSLEKKIDELTEHIKKNKK